MTSSDVRKILELQEENNTNCKTCKTTSKYKQQTQVPMRPYKTMCKIILKSLKKDTFLYQKSWRPRKTKKFKDDFPSSDESSDTEEKGAV